MGYKSTLRSLNSMANKAARERNRQINREQRLLEKLTKKASAIDAMLQKIYQELDDVYAKGKISNKEYAKLSKRKKDIGMELIVLTKTPGTSLAKRYITGKISKKEFEQIKKEILPTDLLNEKDEMFNEFDKLLKKAKAFKKITNKKKDNTVCWHCNSEGSFFNGIRRVEDVRLCRKCSSELRDLLKYKGFEGKYFTIEGFKLDYALLEKARFTLNAKFRDEYILNY